MYPAFIGCMLQPTWFYKRTELMQSKAWVKVTIPANELGIELLAGGLEELGVAGILYGQDSIEVFFNRARWLEGCGEKLEDLRRPFITAHLLPDGPVSVEAIVQEDWISRWRISLGAVRAGDRFVIVPPQVEYAANPDDILLKIEPRMAFGTGEHATTRMALALMESTINEKTTLLDLGCGNGILSLGALLLNAKSVIAVDYEPESVIEALENLKACTIPGTWVVLLANVLRLPLCGRFNCFVANILFEPVMEGLASWTELAEPFSSAILTGIQAGGEAASVVSLASSLGWRLSERREREGWFAARFNRVSA